MNKIGILTFNRAINYGAVLQAYALKKSIEKYAPCNIINYETIYGKRDSCLSLKNLIKKIIFRKKYKRFYDFINNNSTDRIYDNQTRASILENNFGKIIVGSDQVWNYTCSGEYPTFLLDFIENDSNIDCYSYAASFGVSSIPNEHFNCYNEHIKKFKNISVREETGKNILKEQFSIDSEVVLDPTLLLDKDEWIKNLNLKKTNKKYILTYFLDDDNDFKEIAKAVSKKTGLPIYNITTSIKSQFGDKTIRNAGPKEWVEYFYNAEFIVTSSFHGTAFAINFNKQFYTYAKNNRSSRIVDLLNTVDLSERRIFKTDEIDLNKKIIYNDANILINDKRICSFEFIKNILNN